MKNIITLFVGILACLSPTLAAEITSPDGNYQMTILDGMRYTLIYKGQTIVNESQMGIDVDNRLSESALAVPRGEHENWCRDFVLTGEERTEVDTTWTPLYGENARIRDHYRQLTLHYEKGSDGQGNVEAGFDKRKYYALDIVIRVYNEGVAFRYHFPETANSLFLHVTSEQTSFLMPEGTLAYYEEWAQGPYALRPLKKDGWFESERPLLLKQPNGMYVALLEAQMKDYVRGKFDLLRDSELHVKLYGSADLISPYNTPWRVIMAGERAFDLINHKDLVLNLNEAPQTDFSFVKPGKAFRCSKLEKQWIMKSIDYCAERGFDYVELDSGWYGPEGKVSSSALKTADTRDFTMPEVCRYAREKGVGVWVYVNQRALYQQLDSILPLYKRWGISGIKFGFVHIGSQQWSEWLHRAVERCAEHGLMVDIHDEYRPTGLSRTYPNLLTQEGIRGNEEMPDADHNTLLPFTRFLCGPADYTLCYFNNRVKNTHAHQLAMAAVYYSPLQFLFWYDLPYTDGTDCKSVPTELDFWWHCPTVFDESIALDGEPGQYIIQARRSGDDWFVGCMTNTEARQVIIPTTFLGKGKYRVTIYNDDPTLDSRTKVSTKTIIIRAGKPITLQLQPSGGAALHISPIK